MDGSYNNHTGSVRINVTFRRVRMTTDAVKNQLNIVIINIIIIIIIIIFIIIISFMQGIYIYIPEKYP